MTIIAKPPPLPPVVEEPYIFACQCALCNRGPRGETIYFGYPQGPTTPRLANATLRDSLDLYRSRVLPSVGRRVVFLDNEFAIDTVSEQVEIENTKTFIKRISNWVLSLYRRCFTRPARPVSEVPSHGFPLSDV